MVKVQVNFEPWRYRQGDTSSTCTPNKGGCTLSGHGVLLSSYHGLHPWLMIEIPHSGYYK